MHKYSFEPSRRNGNKAHQPSALSRREVLLEAPKKKKHKSSRGRDPNAPASRSSSVSILTSETSRSRNDSKSQPHYNSVPAARFYEKPKSLLETQYERNLQMFVPVDTSDDFLPLESDPVSMPIHEESNNLQAGKEAESVISSEISAVNETSNNVSELLLDPARKSEVHVMYFIHASDVFMRQAHSLALGANDIRGTKLYFSLVKSAIKSLTLLIRQYSVSLNPVLESVIYHKLGMIYLKETLELEKAEHFIKTAISLSSKHKLTKLQITNEFIYCQILEQMNPGTSSGFLSDKQVSYQNKGLTHISDLFALIKTNHVLLGDASLGLASSATSIVRSKKHTSVKVLTLVHGASLNICHGILSQAESMVKGAQSLLKGTQYPPQMSALCNLTLLACYAREDAASGRDVVGRLKDFISQQRETDWAGWRDDGVFCVPIPLTESNADSSTFEVQWLNSDEFVILVYFLDGMLDISDFSSLERTKKIFTSCLEFINIQLAQLTDSDSESKHFRISHLTEKIVRLSFIRYSVIYYKIWIEFAHERNYSGISSIKYFLECFDGDSFTKEEMCYYKLLVAKFLYLAGLYYQAQGDLNAAQFYFLRVKKASTGLGDSKITEMSSIQNALGIGCEVLFCSGETTELSLFSSLHLILIAESNLSAIESNRTNDSATRAKLLASHGVLSDLLSDLSSVLDKSEDDKLRKHVEVSSLFQLSYRVALLLHHRDVSPISADLKGADHLLQIRNLVSKTPSSGFLRALSTYLLRKHSTDFHESKRLLQEIETNINSGDPRVHCLGRLILPEIPSKVPGSVENAVEPGEREVRGRVEFARVSAQL